MLKINCFQLVVFFRKKFFRAESSAEEITWFLYTSSKPLVYRGVSLSITGSYLTFRFERLFLDGLLESYRVHIRILSITHSMTMLYNNAAKSSGKSGFCCR